MNIVITGANGLLGTELIHQLLFTDHKIYALTSNKEAFQSKWNENIQVHSLSEWEKGIFTFKEIDVVVHCAFTRSSNGDELAESLIISEKVFKQAFDYKCNIINISSRSVYGQNPNIPWTESTQVCPDNLYGLAKYSSELLLSSIFNSALKSLKYTNIRLAGLLTPSFNERIVNKLIDNVINGRPISITGGNQQFGFLDVSDAANALIQIINSENDTWQNCYNLGALETHTIIDIAEFIAEKSLNFNVPKATINLTKSDASLFADMKSELFYKDFKWQPTLSIQEIINRIFEYKLNEL